MLSKAVIVSTRAQKSGNLYQRLWKNIGVTYLNKEKAGDSSLSLYLNFLTFKMVITTVIYLTGFSDD